MLTWAVVFFILAIIAGFVGFGGIAIVAAGTAKLLFYALLVLFVGSLIFHFAGRPEHDTDDLL